MVSVVPRLSCAEPGALGFRDGTVGDGGLPAHGVHADEVGGGQVARHGRGRRWDDATRENENANNGVWAGLSLRMQLGRLAPLVTWALLLDVHIPRRPVWTAQTYKSVIRVPVLFSTR